MGASPIFTAAVRLGAVKTVASADTSFGASAPTNKATLITAASTGTKVEHIRVVQVLTTTTSGTVNLFITDGTTYYLLEAVHYDAHTISTTATQGPVDLYYEDLVLPSASWSIAVTNTVAAGTGTTAATHSLVCFAGDF